MTRKKASRLFMEMSRRIHLEYHGSLQGFGKVASFYRRSWRPDVKQVGGYKAAWNSDIVVQIRNTVGM